jgi:thioredoxin-related protein
LTGLDFSRSDRTLVFVISSQCPYCRQSEGFYRSLTGTSSQYKNLQFAAALPQPESEGRAYLQQAGLNFGQVVSADPETMGVGGTPTLVLVDKKGNVLRYWMGKLPPEGEKRVLAAIRTQP